MGSIDFLVTIHITMVDRKVNAPTFNDNCQIQHSRHYLRFAANGSNPFFPAQCFHMTPWLNGVLRCLLLAICASTFGCASQPGRVVSHALPSPQQETAPIDLKRKSVSASLVSSPGSADFKEPVSADPAIDRMYGSEKATTVNVVPAISSDSDSSASETALTGHNVGGLASECLPASGPARGHGETDVTRFAGMTTPVIDAPMQSETTVSGSFIPQMAQLQGQYIIEPGDTLEVKFRVTHDLDEIVNVRPDGMISLQIVGDFPAAGFTCEQLRQGLVAAYSDQLQDPDIAVIIRTFSGNGIYIGGEVNAPGRVALNGRITTLQAIILAGGFKDTADQKRVVVRHGDGTCCEYDLKSVAECSNNIPDIVLRSSDVVYVPKSHIAKVNLFVEQYIDKVLPFSRSFGVFVNQTVPGSML